MSIIVTDAGFGRDSNSHGFVTPEALDADSRALDLGPEDHARALAGRLDGVALIRVAFPAFSDGRGFTIGRELRQLGFAGRLRAAGHVLADQYAMLRRSGFDEVEISDDLATRQPEAQWRFRADWQAHDHRTRLFA